MTNKPYHWVPTLYLMQGLPFGLTTITAVVLYKYMGLSNQTIALLTSSFVIPYILKPFIAPILEMWARKKQIVVSMQMSMSVLAMLLAAALNSANEVYLVGLILFSISTASAIHDISADGIYIVSLDNKQQAFYIGIKSLFYQVGRLLTQGFTLFIAGFLILHFGNHLAWQISIILWASLAMLIALYHVFLLPNDTLCIDRHNIKSSYKNVIHDFLHLPHLWAAIIFLLLFNLPETQMIRMLPLFLLDGTAVGGANIGVRNLGLFYGSIDLVFLLLGLSLSGLLLARYSLKSCLVPFTMLIGVANVGYILLATFHIHSIWVIASTVSFAQFAFGLGNGAYMLYLLKLFAKGDYAMSLYSIGTAFMMLGYFIGGVMSGYVQHWLGYLHFFIWIAMLSIGITMLAYYQVKRIL